MIPQAANAHSFGAEHIYLAVKDIQLTQVW